MGIGSSTGFGETYAFSPTQNNGQILSQTDTRTGETVSYRYDALGRLANAAATASSVGAAWAMSFGYDGFGNRYGQNMTAGTGPTVNFGFDANNHINYPAGYSYDGNGNLTSVPGASGPVQYDYDYDNRLKGYRYGIDGKRLVQVTPFESSQPGPKVRLGVYLYLPGGQIQGIYDYNPYRTYSSDGYPRDWAFQISPRQTRVYFAGRWVGGVDVNSRLIYRVAEDRRGSVRASATFSYVTRDLQSTYSGYFPYGEQRYGNGAHFATYTRDENGLDYAQQRQYSSAHGVFTTADPFQASTSSVNNAEDGLSWNRYTYTRGNPVNRTDRYGLWDDENGDADPEPPAPSPEPQRRGDPPQQTQYTTCQLALYFRPVRVSVIGKHAYLEITKTTTYVISRPADVERYYFEGGPNRVNDKQIDNSLYGFYSERQPHYPEDHPPALGESDANYKADTQSLLTDIDCSLINVFRAAIYAYDSGTRVEYGAVPAPFLKARNSNSFVYTLLIEYLHITPSAPFYSPGWVLKVPGL